MEFNDYSKCIECESENIIVVYKTCSNQTKQYRFQCLNCGYINKDSIKYKTIPENVNPVEEIYDLTYKYKEDQQEQFLLQQKERRELFFDQLNDYYSSKEWQAKRLLRLEFNKKLFNGLCERCNIEKATTVHHRGYFLLGKEHPFDLECLCHFCHSLIHEHLQ